MFILLAILANPLNRFVKGRTLGFVPRHRWKNYFNATTKIINKEIDCIITCVGNFKKTVRRHILAPRGQ